MIEGKKILIFGGTGSLGHKLTERYLNDNTLYLFSRDESKHWKMRITFSNHKNLNFIIGNVFNADSVAQAINRVRPNIIIIASAMKHIDQCELNTNESLKTNLLGTKNILDYIENSVDTLKLSLETVLFVSSDKACNPINNYGMCKAMSETLVVEKAFYVPEFKFVNIRYGNVLNSNGSIIPLLHKIGSDKNKPHFTLTHEDMTRFVMTLDQSVDLIEYTIENGESGDTVIPKLVSFRIKYLLEIFSELYNKPIIVTGIRPGEKLLESLINKTQSGRIEQNDNYTHIKSVLAYKEKINTSTLRDYNSNINPMDKKDIKIMLEKLELL